MTNRSDGVERGIVTKASPYASVSEALERIQKTVRERASSRCSR